MTARIFPARGLRETAFARVRPFHQLARLVTKQNWIILTSWQVKDFLHDHIFLRVA
jgi:hypothetical protein